MGRSLGKTAEHRVSGSSRAAGSSAQLTLLQCGFSKLFEANCKSVQDGDGNAASSDESSDEQPTCLSAEAKQAACQKTQDSVCISEHQKSENIQNPNEKYGFDKSKKTLEQNVSSQSDDERKYHSTDGHHGMGQNDTESEDSDVIYPTQYPAQKAPNNRIRFKLLFGESEDSEAENPVKRNCVAGRQNSGKGNGPVSKPLSTENMTLKLVRKRKDTDDISDESDDINMFPKSRIRKQRATTSLKFKRKKENKRELCKSPGRAKEPKQVHAADGDCSSQVIDDFSSSDDNVSVSHWSSSRPSHRAETVKDKISLFSKLPGPDKKNNTFISKKPASFLNERVVSQEQMSDSMDKILGKYNCRHSVSISLNNCFQSYSKRGYSASCKIALKSRYCIEAVIQDNEEIMKWQVKERPPAGGWRVLLSPCNAPPCAPPSAQLLCVIEPVILIRKFLSILLRFCHVGVYYLIA